VSRIEAIDGRPPDQIGILVPDLEEALERYERIWGGGPWRIFTYAPGRIPWLTYRGRPGTYSLRLAISSAKPQIELVEPLEGPSIYEEFLERGGQGLHHLGFWVTSLEQAVASFEAAGYEQIQAGGGYGLDGDGGYAYFETERDFGVILEAIELPKRRREPDSVWPS
jgi:catechol 2,3-dioxygenase-like lactoylglutathione lyase family enzyme